MTRIDTRAPRTREPERSDISPARPPVQAKRAASATSVDVVAGTGMVTVGHVVKEATAGLVALSGPNPFAALAQAGVASPLRLNPVGLELTHDLSPSAPVLAGLTTVEAGVVARGAENATQSLGALGKVREGMMLLLVDAPSHGELPQDLLESAGEVAATIRDAGHEVATLESKLLATAQRVKNQLPLSLDVNAYVQAVLRESYLLQTEGMRDFADKVKYYNELKKQLRAKKAEAMKLRATLGDGAKADAALFTRFNPQTGEWELFPVGADASADDPLAMPGASGGSGGASTPSMPAAARPVPDGFFVGPAQGTGSPRLDAIAADIRELRGQGFDWNTVYEKALWVLAGKKQTGDDLSLLMASEIPHASPDVFATVLQCELEKLYYARSTDNAESREKAKQVLASIAGVATPEQLAYFKRQFPAEWASFASVAGGADIQGEVARFETSFAALPYELRTAPPPTAELASMFTAYRAGDASALERMKSALWTAEPNVARDFLALVRGTCEAAVFDQLFASLDGGRVFRTAAPEEWSFLCEGGPTATAFYEQWTGGEAPVSASRPLSIPALGGRDPQLVATLARDPRLPSTAVRVVGVSGTVTVGANQTVSSGAVPEVSSPAPELVTPSREGLDSYISQLEEDLATVGDDAQLANVDLQNSLQQQQQTLQMMSNISKMMHDTIMAIIRNMGG